MSPRSVIAGLTARRSARQGALWGLAFGLVVASSVTGYTSAYPTAADRTLLQTSLSSNAGAQALLGPIRRIDTVAGFTAWRAGGVVMLIGAVWALLVSTKLLRGEEDAGRWEVLLAGRTTRRGAAGQAVAGLAAGWGAMFAVTAVVVAVVGRTSDASFGLRSSLFFALALVAAPAVFLGIGALTSQLATTRRRAAGMAAAALGVAFVLRMVAATSSGVRWMRWASPLGWVDELQPLTGSAPWLLVPIVGACAATTAAAVHLAGTRDVGAGVLPGRDQAPARTRWLNSPLELAVRLTRGVALGWVTGVAALGVVLGLVARSAGESLTQSAYFDSIRQRLGLQGSGAELYLGFSFLIIALLVALVTAGQVAATRDEETEGRLEHLLVRPVRRTGWLAGRLTVSTVLAAVCGVVAGASAWIGAAVEDSGVSFVRMLEAGANVVPPALAVLGIGTLAHALRPRLAPAVAYAVVAWSFFVELVGALVNAHHLLLDTSVFHHMRPAPGAAVDWGAAGVLLAIGLVAALLGGWRLDRRDLVGA